jgi:hypothetical protein
VAPSAGSGPGHLRFGLLLLFQRLMDFGAAARWQSVLDVGEDVEKFYQFFGL